MSWHQAGHGAGGVREGWPDQVQEGGQGGDRGSSADRGHGGEGHHRPGLHGSDQTRGGAESPFLNITSFKDCKFVEFILNFSITLLW